MPALPEFGHGDRSAVVIAGKEWQEMATNLLSRLTPESPGHGVYFQAFLADGVLYRDTNSLPRLSSLGQQPAQVIIDRRYSIDETIETLASTVESSLIREHPGQDLFVMMAPNAGKYTQALLLDRRHRECVWFSPAALYDRTERDLGVAATSQSISALLFESHGLALIKNPLSSVFRLADMGLQTALRFIRAPRPRGHPDLPPVGSQPGMDLLAWEKWLDTYTGTRQQEGSMFPLVDGDRFFPRIKEAIRGATNRIDFDIYIFDKDDVGVDIANELKARSKEIKVRVILDRMGSIAGGAAPPATPLPEDFFSPASIIRYLGEKSEVRVRPFLNPWLSSDHSKVFIVDGARAWMGGMNLGREYRYEWHDMMVEISGPVVASLEGEFKRAWAHEGLLGDAAYLGALLNSEPAIPCKDPAAPKVRLLPTKTAWKPFNTAVQGAFKRARNYIYLENPYLFDKRVISALVRARRRGVDVRVILPRANDLKAGRRSNLVTANYLLEQGVRVYFYPGMTHVKALLVDDWALVGSGNLNHLSLRLCQEHNIATSNPDFIQQLKHELFENDFARAYEMSETLNVDWMDFITDMLLENF